MPFPLAHRYSKRIDLTNQPKHKSKGKLRDHHRWFRHPPAKRNDYASLSGSRLVNMIGMTSGLKDKFQSRAGFEEALVQFCSFTQSQEDFNVFQDAEIIDRVI